MQGGLPFASRVWADIWQGAVDPPMEYKFIWVHKIPGYCRGLACCKELGLGISIIFCNDRLSRHFLCTYLNSSDFIIGQVLTAFLEVAVGFDFEVVLKKCTGQSWVHLLVNYKFKLWLIYHLFQVGYVFVCHGL